MGIISRDVRRLLDTMQEALSALELNDAEMAAGVLVDALQSFGIEAQYAGPGGKGSVRRVDDDVLGEMAWLDGESPPPEA